MSGSGTNQTPAGFTTPYGLIHINRVPSEGIHAPAGTIVHTLARIEQFVHGYSALFGKIVTPVTGREADLFPDNTTQSFQVAAGANSWGAITQIFGTNDFDFATGKKFFSLTNMIVNYTSLSGFFIIQFAHGTGTAAAAFANFNTRSTFPILLPTPVSSATPIRVELGIPAVGEKVWVRAWRLASPGANVDFVIGNHFYENGVS